MLNSMMRRLERLIDSRDYDNAPGFEKVRGHQIRRLSSDDESMMCEVTQTASGLVREVSTLTFFKGKMATIFRGNRECSRCTRT